MSEHPTSPPVGRVIGTDPATPLEFWVAVSEDRFLQLDDVVVVERSLPGRSEPIRIYGMVADLRVRHEGARFDSDVFLIEDGVLPAQVTEAAKVLATRFEPEVFVPPVPGEVVRKAVGKARDEALFFDGMERRIPAGLSRDGEVIHANLEFMDGTRGAHVNISGVSGVATKTSYAVFLLHSLFTSGELGAGAHNTKALIFNVKGEDLLFLDRPNRHLDGEQMARYTSLGLPASPFASVELWAPPRRGDPSAAPRTGSRADGVTSFFWTLAEFCQDELLPFLFADAGDERQQYTIVVHNVTARLRREANPLDDGGVRLGGVTCRTFEQLIDVISDRLEDDADRGDWAGRSIGTGTINAFVRRLYASRRDAEHLVRGDVPNPGKHRIGMQAQVAVVDIAKLSRRAQRFVVGVVLCRTFRDKEETGAREPLLFVVLDELNKYAPREGHSPIKEILLDMAERGRSLGVILIGAQQTASEVERRVIANSSLRVAGRLDSAEAGRPEYAFLPTAHRQRATILKPGTMILSQPELPVPLVLEFPFPAWATRPDEVGTAPGDSEDTGDPFEGLVE
ncbi:MAG: ATP-binding protein [Gemmatimonadota bacterium]|nr:ATP-binding protein [Gemmatimonadota bacterium]